MSVALFVVGGILAASGLYMLFFRATHDAAVPGSEMKLGEMKVSSSKPSLFLIAIGIVVLLIAAKMYSDEKQQQRVIDMFGGRL
jgi:hypothetical protein